VVNDMSLVLMAYKTVVSFGRISSPHWSKLKLITAPFPMLRDTVIGSCTPNGLVPASMLKLPKLDIVKRWLTSGPGSVKW